MVKVQSSTETIVPMLTLDLVPRILRAAVVISGIAGLWWGGCTQREIVPGIMTLDIKEPKVRYSKFG